MKAVKTNLISNLLLVLGSVIFTLLAVEIVGRIIFDEWRLINFHAEEQTLFSAGYPVEFDDELGWVPKPGASGQKNVWGTTVTIGEDGIRSNGSSVVNTDGNKPLILAVGDSYTFGDEVSDHETWPALLEKSTGYKVINGGVFGYGLDQSYLRLEQLVKKFKPQIVVFSLIDDDIFRCEMSIRTAAFKPYFDIKDGSLVRYHKPVPRPFESESQNLLKDIGGRILVVHKIMMKLSPG